jgi:chromate transporter
MMEERIVRRRGWLTREDFLELVAVANLLPGPTSTELAIHVGMRRAGVPGLLVAGLAFIVPASLIVGVCAWAYVRYGAVPAVHSVWRGVQPVVVAVVGLAVVEFGRASLATRRMAAVALISLGLAAIGSHELLVLLLAGLAGLAIVPGRFAAAAWLLPAGAALTEIVSSGSIFLLFLRVGSVLYGSGYVLLAFLRGELVERAGWLTEAQLLDAVAVGQATPGPLFTTATFIGFLLGGPTGALAATAGIFLPAFVFVAASGPLIRWIRRSGPARAFLDGVVAASVALMALVTWELALAAIDRPVAALITLASVLLLRSGANSALLMLAGACVGLLLG